jgi:hypothetical protein
MESLTRKSPLPPPLPKRGIRAESKRSLDERLSFPTASWERIKKAGLRVRDSHDGEIIRTYMQYLLPEK